jgi:hypothetical protein
MNITGKPTLTLTPELQNFRKPKKEEPVKQDEEEQEEEEVVAAEDQGAAPKKPTKQVPLKTTLKVIPGEDDLMTYYESVAHASHPELGENHHYSVPAYLTEAEAAMTKAFSAFLQHSQRHSSPLTAILTHPRMEVGPCRAADVCAWSGVSGTPAKNMAHFKLTRVAPNGQHSVIEFDTCTSFAHFLKMVHNGVFFERYVRVAISAAWAKSGNPTGDEWVEVWRQLFTNESKHTEEPPYIAFKTKARRLGGTSNQKKAPVLTELGRSTKVLIQLHELEKAMREAVEGK